MLKKRDLTKSIGTWINNALHFINQTQDHRRIRVQGIFGVQDLLALQDLARYSLQSNNRFRVLIELEDFAVGVMNGLGEN